VAVCSSGTSALEGAVSTTPEGVGLDLPAWTFTATPGSVIRSGRAARFVDVDLAQRAVFDPSTEHAIDVLPFGTGPDWDRPGAARQTVIVDAAASYDACESFPFPSESRVGVVVSLHATKSLPAGEGGVFFSNDEGWVADFRRWGNFGMWGSRVSQVPGINAKMSELTAAVAHASLDAWPQQRAQWRELAMHAHRVASELGVAPPGTSSASVAMPYWNIVLRDAEARQGLEEFLGRNGVETRRWWGDGCHVMPAYEHVPRPSLPVDGHAATMLGLPFHLGLGVADLDYIGSLVSRYLDGHPG
jgi:dTDP-4-amino-4,6-dideoxygalactose transaminase